MKNNLLLILQTSEITSENWLSSPGVIGTIVLIFIVLFLGIFIFIKRLNRYVDVLEDNKKDLSEEDFERRLINLDKAEVDHILKARQQGFKDEEKPADTVEAPSKYSGFIKKIIDPENPLFDEKARSTTQIKISKELKQIIVWYLGAGIFWLVFGTLVGQYLGMKFIWPDLDKISWLSFGRLRPVHTNTVFWGWASLAMVGLGHYVVSRTSNREIFNYKWSKIAFWLINSCVFIGNIFLMAGINNGGGEYREYIWPIMALFAIGLIIIFFNFYKTVATRKISEIYISNWFILASLIWTIVLAIIGYFPSYQDGLGETVIQGYYMHQGVGMWFMTFTLGLVYYFLPSALNKPIYSYSLGVLAFWTQMLFYTLIGTHHFVFSPLPWWLQTVAIVFSAGMFIPVFAGTTNFLMTMRGSWNHISKSYVLPFFLVGVVFYFVGSVQGSFQAFRFTNYLWHFTDFNVAHSHMTMYGIITFLMWACIYALLPKITGKEPPQNLVGAHFWLAFIGLIAYMVSLMVGGTLKGLSWIEGNPFIESVILMENYWVWRAVGGTLMFISHIIFAYNFYLMVRKKKKVKHSFLPDRQAQKETLNTQSN
ncbi:cytochrome oxidase subunit I [Psychroflexus gondwanensis]|uniref:Cbb3-type cytochrome c oxidase subunit I n=1 Tax=Psychroflexus gondwanensis ACAM 44 TaxID=1189619 RepID=N1WNI5_9FLAO|nr:cbb3-type cytochrome c oxidase subunit I [Psychroflexus gondwanensis]EMY80525.1 cbb3-type cytochrome c oxidase subunit I [Psychroflexus gondwanensis ACAM 44]TXE20558.1 cytochrome oxidase subunit I [Psychroflexus gondwanensis]